MIESSRIWWEEDGLGPFDVIERESGLWVGRVGLWRLSQWAGRERYEVGFEIAPAFWRRGFASEAGQAAVRFGFSRGLSRIISVTVAENAGSRATMERCGLAFAGARVWNGCDVVWYAIDRARCNGYARGGACTSRLTSPSSAGACSARRSRCTSQRRAWMWSCSSVTASARRHLLRAPGSSACGPRAGRRRSGASTSRSSATASTSIASSQSTRSSDTGRTATSTSRRPRRHGTRRSRRSCSTPMRCRACSGSRPARSPRSRGSFPPSRCTAGSCTPMERRCRPVGPLARCHAGSSLQVGGSRRACR